MLAELSDDNRLRLVREHFTKKGYRVHSGLQFGCELVLYADDPGRVHSDFCVHVLPADGCFDWRMMQTLVRSMPDLHKTLLLANLTESDGEIVVEEVAIATEHAPFRHKQVRKEVGGQTKRQKVDGTEVEDPKFGQ